MNSNNRAKTLTSSLSHDSRALFQWVSEPTHLDQWYRPLAKFAPVRFVRDDRANLLDLVFNVNSAEVTLAIRIFASGEGSELVLTLIKPEGLPESAFQDQARWAGSALAQLKKIKLTPESFPAVAGGEPIQSGASMDSRPESAEDDKSKTAPTTGRKLFVGNLPFAWMEEQLQELFAPHGTIASVAIPRLRGRGGRSRGFGFVEMSTEAEAQTAIEKLHNGLAGERKIVVRLAQSQESRPERASVPPSELESAAIAHESGLTLDVADEIAPIGNRIVSEPSSIPRGRHRRGAPSNRPPRPGRAPRPARPPRPSHRDNSPHEPGEDRSISNSSGYEIYPRDSKGGFASVPNQNERGLRGRKRS